MTFAVGDIILLDSPVADHRKYHLSLGTNESLVTICLFLNSDDRFEGSLVFDCSEIPDLPPSKTGKSVVSLTMLPRFNERQLQIFRAKKVGVCPRHVAEAVIAASATAKALTKPERLFIVERLTQFVSAV